MTGGLWLGGFCLGTFCKGLLTCYPRAVLGSSCTVLVSVGVVCCGGCCGAYDDVGDVVV